MQLRRGTPSASRTGFVPLSGRRTAALTRPPRLERRAASGGSNEHAIRRAAFEDVSRSAFSGPLENPRERQPIGRFGLGQRWNAELGPQDGADPTVLADDLGAAPGPALG